MRNRFPRRGLVHGAMALLLLLTAAGGAEIFAQPVAAIAPPQQGNGAAPQQGSGAAPQAEVGPAPQRESGTAVQQGGDPMSVSSVSDHPYTLHPGDTIDVTFRFTPEFNDEVTVAPDGHVSLKSTGDIQVAGYTLTEIRRRIALESADKLVNPEVAVSLKDFERPHVVVAGEVQTPGRFELRGPLTAVQAILLAGGPKQDSAMGRVILFRRINSTEAEVHVLQLGRYDARSRARNDLLLQPDDMLLVRHDNLSKVERIVKLANIGVYFNVLGNNGLLP